MSRTSPCCFALNSFLVICGLGIQLLPGQTPQPGVQLIVGVYNYAAVPADTLDRAEEQAAKILGGAGIELHWVDCPVVRQDTEKLRSCAQAEASGGHYLEFLPQSMAARRRSAVPHRFGYAVPPHFAYVFAERVEGLAR